MKLTKLLEPLEQNELVHPVAHEEQTYIFKNTLAQETAYASLLLKQRRHLHRLVAQAYEQIYTNRLDGYAGILAQHYAQAGDDAKTVEYALYAGDEACRVYANQEAHQFYQIALAALERLEGTDQRRRQHADTLVKQVSVAFSFQSSDDSFDNLYQAESIAQELYNHSRLKQDRLRLARIHYWLGRMHVYRNQIAQAIDVLMRVLDEASDADDPALLAYPSAIIGRIMNTQGQFGAANILLRQALEPIERAGNTPEWIFTVGHLGLAMAARGDYANGLAKGQHALQRAIDINNASSIAEMHVILAAIYYMGGDYAQMLNASRACIKVAEPADVLLYLVTAHASHALAASYLGDHATARQAITQAQAIGKTMSANHAYSDWVASAYAQVQLHAGAINEAVDAARTATELAHSLGGIFAMGLAERVWALALAATSAGWDEIEMHLLNSLMAFEAGEARLEMARTHCVWGNLGAQHQRPNLAHEQWTQAIEQFQLSGLENELTSIRQQMAQLKTA